MFLWSLTINNKEQCIWLCSCFLLAYRGKDFSRMHIVTRPLNFPRYCQIAFQSDLPNNSTVRVSNSPQNNPCTRIPHSPDHLDLCLSSFLPFFQRFYFQGRIMKLVLFMANFLYFQRTTTDVFCVCSLFDRFDITEYTFPSYLSMKYWRSQISWPVPVQRSIFKDQYDGGSWQREASLTSNVGGARTDRTGWILPPKGT